MGRSGRATRGVGNATRLYLVLQSGSRLRMKFIFAAAMAVCLVASALGYNSLEQGFTCPIDGHEWKQRVESSANPQALRLDLRQLGDVMDPPTLPQCPKCRFPFFSERVAEQANEPEKAEAFNHLRRFILGADFQLLARKYPSYFCLAQVQEFLHAPHRHIALSYQRASWQVENREAMCGRLLEKAHEHFVAALAEMKPDDRRFAEVALLCGDTERRLGRWDEAEKRFRDLQDGEGQRSPRKMPIFTMQLKLIAKRDSHPKTIDEPSDESKAVADPGPLAISKPQVKPAEKPPTPVKIEALWEALELPGEPGKPGLGLDFSVPSKSSGGPLILPDPPTRPARKGKAKSNLSPAAN